MKDLGENIKIVVVAILFGFAIAGGIWDGLNPPRAGSEPISASDH